MQQNPQPKIRNGQTPQRRHRRGVVDERAVLHCRHDTNRHTDRQRDHKGNCGQLAGDRQLFEHEIEHRPLDADGFTKIPRKDALDPEQIADRQRLVEMILLAQKGDHLRIAVFAGQCEGRIPGQELLQPEDQNRDEEQGGHDEREAAEQERGHPALPSRCSFS